MTKISTYGLDQDVVGGDKWIGSDIQNQNRTKNFTPDRLASYFNNNQIVNIGMPIQYKYYTLDPLEVRPIGTLTFETEIGASVPFSTITTFLLSKYTTKQNDVSQYLDFLNHSKVLLYRSNDINQFGFYEILTLEPYILDPTFFVLTVDFIEGNGSMLEDKDYMISLVSLEQEPIPTKTSDLINDGEDGVHPFITLEDIPPVTGFVPYTGATQDVNLGEFGVQLGNIEFDNTPTNIPTGAGSMYWNDADGTTDLILKGGNVTLQVGQEQVLRVVNKTATNVNLLESNYQAVRVTGAQGQRLKVDLAQATNDILSAETIGLVTETINNNQEGFITTSGLVRSINTTGSIQGETWADGDVIYLSPTTAGNVTKVKPTAPNHLVIIGYVVHAHITQGSIFVKVDNGYELDELHNVKITTPLNNNVLGYNSTTSIWENKTVIDVLGFTPYDATNPNGYTSNLGTITNVSALTLGTTGTDLSSTVANSTTTPVITLNVPTASALNRGALSSADWTSFNNKFTLPTLTSGSVLFSNGTTIAQDNANFFWDDTNNRLNIGGVTSNTARLGIKAQGALSTDIALRVRNSADTADLIVSNGVGDFGIGIAPTLGRLHLQGRTGQTALFLKQAGDGASDGIIMYGLSSAQSSRIYVDANGSMVFNKAGSNIMAVTLTGVAIGLTTPLSSAFLQIDSTTKGFLPPRMTNAQRTAIATPAIGLCVYCTDATEGLYINKSTGWTFIG